MKKLILTMLVIMVSCSNNEDSCDLKKQAISDKYDNLIRKLVEGHNANEINYKQIELLRIEKNRSLSEACK